MLSRALETLSHAVQAAAVTIQDFGFDEDNLNRANRAVVSAATNNVMLTWDGTVPTATLGHCVKANYSYVVDNPSSVVQIQLIRQTANATVTITLERV